VWYPTEVSYEKEPEVGCRLILGKLRNWNGRSDKKPVRLGAMKRRYRFLAGTLCIAAGLALCGAASAVAQGSEPPRLPVLLIHGYQPLAGYAPTMLWQTLAESLSGNAIDNNQEIVLCDNHSIFHLVAVTADRRDVFISDYGWGHEPTARDIRLYSARVSDEIAWITDALECEHVDVVAHSLAA